MMNPIINQYSILFFALPAVLFAVMLLLRRRSSRVSRLAAILFLAAATLAFLLLRPGAGNTTPAEIETILAAGGQPVFVEVYSDY